MKAIYFFKNLYKSNYCTIHFQRKHFMHFQAQKLQIMSKHKFHQGKQLFQHLTITVMQQGYIPSIVQLSKKTS